MKVLGKLVDVENKRIFNAEVVVANGKIRGINEVEHDIETYIMPGFIDAHIHIESSMLVPSEFAKIAVRHGTVATVSDPHEIANVLGVPGIDFMIENGNTVPFKFNFGAPSCVPATNFETAGAHINANDVESLLARPEIKYLSEMMNYPGVLHQDDEVLKKIDAAKTLGKPIDGHAPGLFGESAKRYAEAGITTDHECYTKEEALGKLKLGMKILIREGSAAKNFEALANLIPEHYQNMMFCSDDKHPDDLVLHHINHLCKRAVEKEVDVFKVLKMACINPIEHYSLDVGRLRVGDSADFIVVKDLREFRTLQTYINGKLVFNEGKILFNSKKAIPINKFECSLKCESDFQVKLDSDPVRIIEAIDGELVTKSTIQKIKLENGNGVSDVDKDILKIAVVNRYSDNAPAIGFIKNFGLKKGAIASSVAHDSHNIIAVGCSDDELCNAVNLLIENKGGICTVNKEYRNILKLEVAGLMSLENAEKVSRKYQELDEFAKGLGATLKAPFMTLSFMALLVIPELKLSDKGLFDGGEFKFVSLEN